MSCKLTCPGCDRYLSSIFRAYEDGRPCPQCGASLSAASEQFYRELPDYRQLPYVGQFAPCDCCEKSVPRSDLATGDDGETWICPSCVGIQDRDLRVDVFTPGGVRVTHIPTGIVTVINDSDEPSQLRAKAKALEEIKRRIAEKETP